jgi:hypothetical protein
MKMNNGPVHLPLTCSRATQCLASMIEHGFYSHKIANYRPCTEDKNQEPRIQQDNIKCRHK